MGICSILPKVLAALAAVSWAFSSPGHPWPADTAADVVARVAGEGSSWQVRTDCRIRDRAVIHLASPSVSAEVDRETNQFLGFIRSGPRAAGPLLGAGEARAAAIAVLRRAGITPEASWVATREDVLRSSRRYQFEWRKYVSGVRLPGTVVVSVDSHTDKLVPFSLLDEPVVVPIEARLTADEAVRLTAQRARTAAYTVESMALWVERFPHYPGPQTVFWEVVIEEAGPRGRQFICRVRADTGEVGALIETLGARHSFPQPTRPGLRTYRPPRLDLAAARRAKIPSTVFELAKARQRAAAAARAAKKRTGR